MPLPLMAIAAAAGTARGVAGAIAAGQNGHRLNRQINKSYKKGDAALRLQQGDIRQSTNESLAARGLLNSGGQQAPVGQTAPTPLTAKMGLGGIIQTAKNNQAGKISNAFAQQSARGQVGAAGTIASGVSQDLSSEFYKERDNLKTEQQNALRQNHTDTLGGIVGSIASGIQTGAQAYGAMTGAQAAHAPGPAMPSGIPAAYGVDVVNPLTALEGPNFAMALPTMKGPR